MAPTNVPEIIWTSSKVDRDLRARFDAARRSASTSGCLDYYGNINNKSIGLKVAEARKLATPPLSHRELARRLKDHGLKVTPAEIAKIETGKRSLNYCQVTMLASVLNTTAHHLLS